MTTRFHRGSVRAALAMAAVLMLGAAACGDSGSSAESTTTTASSDPTTTSAEADDNAQSDDNAQADDNGQAGATPGETEGSIEPLADPVTLNVQVDSTYWQEPMNYAVDQGWFEEVGITINPVAFAGDTAIPLVLNGESDIGVTAMGNVVVASGAGLEMRAIAGMFVEGEGRDNILSSIVAAPDSGITDVRGLEGATIAVNELRSASVAKAMQRVREAGGDPTTIEWVAMPFPGMVEAMTRGDVDAAVIVAPFTPMAEAAGAIWLGPLAYVNDPVPVFFAKADWIADNEAVASTFLAVLERAYDHANANREDTKASFVERSGTPPEIADALPDLTWVARLSRSVVEQNVGVLTEFELVAGEVGFDDVAVAAFAD